MKRREFVKGTGAALGAISFAVLPSPEVFLVVRKGPSMGITQTLAEWATKYRVAAFTNEAAIVKAFGAGSCIHMAARAHLKRGPWPSS